MATMTGLMACGSKEISLNDNDSTKVQVYQGSLYMMFSDEFKMYPGRLDSDIVRAFKEIDTPTCYDREGIDSLEFELSKMAKWNVFINKGDSSKKEKGMNLAKRLNIAAINYQKKAFPRIREEYANILRKKGYEVKYDGEEINVHGVVKGYRDMGHLVRRFRYKSIVYEGNRTLLNTPKDEARVEFDVQPN